MADSNYWIRSLNNRRTFLRRALAGGTVVAGLGILGCSSSKNSGKAADDKGTTSTGTQAIDSRQGKPGGTLTFMIPGPWPSNDLLRQGAQANRMGGFTNNGLLQFRYGQQSVDAFDPSVEPDVAQAMPEQPDPLTFVFKLRSGIKFHNGRTMTAEDVKYSLDAYGSPESAYRLAWNQWFDRSETPDPQTVVVKTKMPYADGPSALAAPTNGFILAREHMESPAAKDQYFGTGPFIFVRQDTAVGSIVLRKNPDYFDKPYPYFDEIRGFWVADPAKRVADFSSKQFNVTWWYAIDQRKELERNRPDAKREVMMNAGDRIYLRGDRPPFNDVRVRQALSMAIDRVRIRNATSGGEGFFDTPFFSTNTYWGARKVEEMSEAVKKVYEFNLAEAKKLMSAAGITQPLDVPWVHYDNTIIGQPYIDRITLTQAGWRDAGLVNVRDTIVPSTTLQATAGNGNYEALYSGPASINHVHRTQVFSSFYTGPNGERAVGSQGNVTYYNNPRVNELLLKSMGEFKLEETRSIYRQVDETLALEQPSIHWDNYPLAYFWDANLPNTRMPIFMGQHHFFKRWWMV